MDGYACTIAKFVTCGGVSIADADAVTATCDSDDYLSTGGKLRKHLRHQAKFGDNRITNMTSACSKNKAK
jgi:hypothetical protein